MTKNISWTDQQRRVIEAPPSARLVVDAGPGTGKTATLCGRIAWLIEHEKLEPGEIWIISFTRTAVAEIRHRVASYVTDPIAVVGIKVATIDSHAWQMNVGFNEDAVIAGSFDENIAEVVKLTARNEHASEYTSTVRHLFIDESQDVVGPRVEFVLELIHAMSATSGLTVLSDQAQAIYEYTEQEGREELAGNLVQNIRKYFPDFGVVDLKEIHRTADPALLGLFTHGRAVVRDEEASGRAKYVEARRTIVECSHARVGDAVEDLKSSEAFDPDTFLLFRRRGEALAASACLADTPHRLRMSGMPAVLYEWIALVFWDWTQPSMTRDEFLSRWARRIPMGSGDKSTAWMRLSRIAGKSEELLDVHKLRRRLASASPPLELCRPDFGARGPVIGTIHAAKGREAEEVRLYLPGAASMKSATDEDFESEARVLFVGATRAKRRLMVGHSFISFSSTLRTSGRAFTRCSAPPWAAQVEIGRAGDIDAEGLVGKRRFANPEAARHAQALIASLRPGFCEIRGKIGDSESGYAYGLLVTTRPAERILFLSNRVTRDLFTLARFLHKKFAPSEIPGLRPLGLRAIAVSPDDPVRDLLHSPWSESGFILAPLLVGYSALQFR